MTVATRETDLLPKESSYCKPTPAGVRMLVLAYHSNCTDGTACDWIFEHMRPIRLSGTSYAVSYDDVDEMSMRPDEVLIFADIAPTPKRFAHLQRENPGRVFVVDHHRSRIQEYHPHFIEWQGNSECLFAPGVYMDSSQSGSVALYHWLNKSFWKEGTCYKEVPPLLEYVQDRDLWKWELPFSREISSYLQTVPYSFGKWNDINIWLKDGRVRDLNQSPMYHAAEMCLRKDLENVERALTGVFSARIGEHEFPCVVSNILQSEIGNALVERDGVPFAAVLSRDEKGWKISLRSNGYDVSVIAQGFGGGGHLKAAGARLTQDQARSLLLGDPLR